MKENTAIMTFQGHEEGSRRSNILVHYYALAEEDPHSLPILREKHIIESPT